MLWFNLLSIFICNQHFEFRAKYTLSKQQQSCVDQVLVMFISLKTWEEISCCSFSVSLRGQPFTNLQISFLSEKEIQKIQKKYVKKSSEMSGFRSHRSRFRREKLTDQANNQEQNSVFSSSLGQKLASFKSCPDPDLEQKFNLLRSRPLFFGACGTCTTFSKAT